MPTSYAQKQSVAQKKEVSSAASVLDSSSQGESLQRRANMANNAAQCASLPPRPNNTGMPDNLKAGIESLSGFSMDDVRVHYNSSKPATVQALAYTQGTDIHVAPGQEKCLPHEAWHVAQQMSGRVSPTTNINGMPVNDNAALEHEADVMGEKAVQCKKNDGKLLKKENNLNEIAQRVVAPKGDPVDIDGGEGGNTGNLPHIAFETLAGGERASELGGLYNDVISKYNGKASVYMGLNTCDSNYKKIGNAIWSYKKTDDVINGEIDRLKVNAALPENAKVNHKIKLMPFTLSLVGLNGKGEKYYLTDVQFDSLKNGNIPSQPSKEKSVQNKNEVVNYEKVEDYNFPFYEARAYIMRLGETLSPDADFFRWIDSDVKNDSSIDAINLMGYATFGEEKDLMLGYLRTACRSVASGNELEEIRLSKDVSFLMDFLKKRDPKSYAFCTEKLVGCEEMGKNVVSKEEKTVYSGFYNWRQREGDDYIEHQFVLPQLNVNEKISKDHLKPIVLGKFLEILNEKEYALRSIFWTQKRDSGERSFIEKKGYIPEPIVYMNPAAHTTACGRLSGTGSYSCEKTQSRESDMAYKGMMHSFVSDFSVTKPIKDYFSDKEVNAFVERVAQHIADCVMTYFNSKKSKSEKLALEQYGNDFVSAMKSSRQSIFNGGWFDAGAQGMLDEVLNGAWQEFVDGMNDMFALWLEQIQGRSIDVLRGQGGTLDWKNG